MLTLSAPVTGLKGVGPQLAERLARLGIMHIQDLLFHLPLRYEDRTRVSPIGCLRPGDTALVEGIIEYSEVVFRPRRTLLCHLADNSGASLTLRFFYFNQQQQMQLQRGVQLRCYGEVRLRGKQLEMVHPEYRRSALYPQAVEECLTPIYPVTQGLQQTQLRRLSTQALTLLTQNELQDWLPHTLLQTHGFPALNESLHYVHRPPPDAALAVLKEGRHPAQQRLAFEELLAHHLGMLLLRQQLKHEAALSLRPAGQWQQQCLQRLPFRLTPAQQRVLQEINHDLAQAHPALRLVQGDVGCGKTIVAALATLQALESGYQAALMAPTELLAEQHYKNFSTWLQNLNIRIGWLSGRMKKRAREQVLADLQTGHIQLAIGTHALFQEDVRFKQLALMIVDEQHRFGVHQRLALREKGKAAHYPHQITMTATPIPRTLAMTAYADLDYSIIDELPGNRPPVQTAALPNTRRDDVITRIARACAQGRQAYWVCTLIEESDVLQCQAAEDTWQDLQQRLPQLKIGLLHGRLKSTEKETIMHAFKNGELHLLVATTVIEVGVDVPNASLMIIENAERLGLSQLHQLRGRVGRGNIASTCVLLYQAPLSEKARKRLQVIRTTTDGFEIARQDLQMRGPGEMLGTRQAGLIDFTIADIVRDAALLPAVQQAAQTLLRDYPQHVQPLIDRWLAQRTRFRSV